MAHLAQTLLGSFHLSLDGRPAAGLRASKVRALLKGRTHVTIEDVQALAAPALRHRLVPTFHAEAEGITVDMIVAELVARAGGAVGAVL